MLNEDIKATDVVEKETFAITCHTHSNQVNSNTSNSVDNSVSGNNKNDSVTSEQWGTDSQRTRNDFKSSYDEDCFS